MRHDFKYSQSHLSAVRQRPDGSVQQQYNMGYHRKHNNHHDEEHYNNYNSRYNKDRHYGPHSNSDEARLNLQNGATENGAIVSALSVSHESEKQWEWLEDTLAKSNRNKETVSKYITLRCHVNVKTTWPMIPWPFLQARPFSSKQTFSFLERDPLKLGPEDSFYKNMYIPDR